jgi:FkbM family methyltransferase
MNVRSLAERLSRGVVLKRRLPSEFGRGRLFVSPEAGGLRYWRRDLGRADPGLLDLVNEFVSPGANVWDIGANVGLFTFAAAYKAGPRGFVLAVEPDVDNVALLEASNRERDARITSNVEIVALASGAPNTRFARLMIAERSRSSNALEGFGLTQAGGSRGYRTVPTMTLDELLESFPAPSVVKIDAEGAEHSILLGASKVLSEVRPVFLMEVAAEPKDRAEAIARLLKDQRYRMYDGSEPRGMRQEVAIPPWACIAIPA